MNEADSVPHRILIAEDQQSTALLMQTLLGNRGYVVEVAEDGEQCLEMARSFKPDLIFLDLMMPKVHGMEALRRLKSDPATQAIGVVVCTAKRYKPDQDQAMELGAFSVLSKPFTKDELVGVASRFFLGLAQAPASLPAPAGGEVYLPEIPADQSFCRLWGTRGSIPVSGQPYTRHGGNTSCIEIGHSDETIVVDAGSGVRNLGLRLLKNGPRKIHLLITHTHWDHIQGFPFFAPLYVPGYEVVVHGATGFRKDLKAVFTGQLDSDYFPVQFEDMRAKVDFLPLEPVLEIAGFRITWEYTHHPAATVGFRFERNGRSLAYISDNEFLYGYMGRPHTITMESEELTSHKRLVELARDADLLIGEAQYLNAEYRAKVGWGHSSLSNACALASLAKVKRWVVTHHDPLHEDDFLDQKLNVTREILRSLDYPIEVKHGYDGLLEYW